MKKDLVKKLRKLQQALKAPKNQYNSFGKYKYRSKEDILEAVKPIIPEGTTILLKDKLVCIEGQFFIATIAEFTDGENSLQGEAIAKHALSKKGMDDSQLSGSTGSYSGKYALQNLLLLDDAKDSDATNMHGKEEVKHNSPTSPLKKEIKKIEVETNINLNKLVEGKPLMQKYIKNWPKIASKERIDSFIKLVEMESDKFSFGSIEELEKQHMIQVLLYRVDNSTNPDFQDMIIEKLESQADLSKETLLQYVRDFKE